MRAASWFMRARFHLSGSLPTLCCPPRGSVECSRHWWLDIPLGHTWEEVWCEARWDVVDTRTLIEFEVGWDLGAAWLEGAKMRRWSAEVWVESRWRLGDARL